MKIKLKRRLHTNMEQLIGYNVKLDDPICINTFRKKIRQVSDNNDLNRIVTVHEKWNKIKDIINKTSDVVIGK